MNSRFGFNKTKSVKFDSTVRSEFADSMPVRDSSAMASSNISQQSWAKFSAVSKQQDLSDSSDLSDESEQDQQQYGMNSSQQLRRFLVSEDRQKELKTELRASLVQTKKERRHQENHRQIVGMISSKVIYKNGGTQSDASSGAIESSIGGIKLDEKTLLEEAFINFHDLVRKHRLKLSSAFLQAELKKRFPSVTITMKIGMSDISYDELKQKRINAWRGFVGRSDLHEILSKFGFFEAVAPAVFDRFVEKIKCLEKRFDKDWIHYSKLLASVYRYKSSMSHLTKKFLMVDSRDGTKRVRSYRVQDEKAAAEFISNRYLGYVKYVAQKEEKKKAAEAQKTEKKKDVPPTEEEKIRASMNVSADHLIGILREKISHSQRSLKEIFRMLDSKNDSHINKAEFKLAFKQANIVIDESILEEVYFRFDVNQDDKVSFNEFLNVILGQEKRRKTNASNLFSEADELVSEIRKFMLSRFNNRRLFMDALTSRNPNKITQDEFCAFLQTFTNREFSRIQMKAVFNFLDEDGKRFLKQDEFMEIYEHQVHKEDINVDILKEQQRKELEKKKMTADESSMFENEAKSFYEQNVDRSPQMSRIDYLTKLQSQANIADYASGGDATSKTRKGMFEKLSMHSAQEIEEEISAQERKKRAKEARERTQIFLRRQADLENVMKVLSEQIQDRLDRTGKSLRDLFNIFSQRTFGYVDEEEFTIMLNFLCQKPAIPLDVIRALFFLFSNYYSRKLSFTLFEKLVLNGTQLHPLYLKFKFRFGNQIDKEEEKISNDFKRFDVSQGKQIISFDDFKKILELNQIAFTEKEERQMVKDGIFMQFENVTYVSYKKLIPLIFPKNCQIVQDIFSRHSKTITRFFKLFKLRKQRKQLEEEAAKKRNAAKKAAAAGKDPKKKTATFSKDAKSSAKGTSATAAPKKANMTPDEGSEQQQPLTDLQRLGEYMKPKELPEFFNPEDSENNTSRATGKKEDFLSSATAAPPGASRKSLKDDGQRGSGTNQAMSLAQQKKLKTSELCGDLLNGMIDKAVVFGESLNLSKEIQRKYEERPVTKDVIVTLKDMDVESQDILPHCIFTSAQTGRIMALDRHSHLHQYDLVSKQKLISLDLSIKVPLKEAGLLGATFDSNSGRLYILTDKWTIEVWELGQDSSSPIGSVVLLSENQDTQKAVNNCYSRRFEGVFPGFISMSENSHQVIVVNASCVNNSVILVDPISLSVINVIYISPSGFGMTLKLNQIINRIAPTLHQFKHNGHIFTELFDGKTKAHPLNEDVSTIDAQDFQRIIYNFFCQDMPEFSYEDWGDLVSFLDQQKTGTIDSTQFEFLFEMIKYQSVRLPDSTEQLVKLGGISEGAFNLLNSFSRFLQKQRKSIEDAFRAFDEKGAGIISCEDFEFIVIRTCKGDENLRHVSELTAFFDKDKNGVIDFHEFAEIFGIASDNQAAGVQFNGRKNLMLCIQKAYEGGVDVENILIKADEYKEGTISSLLFRNILKWLPIGMTEDEVEYIMQNSVSYSDNGGVNYVKLLTSEQFRTVKENFEFKKSIASSLDFHEGKKNEMNRRKDEDTIAQKVVVETAIFLDDFDLLVYTTVCPPTSQIFISKSNKPVFDESKSAGGEASGTSDFFTNKLLAKLQGHKSHNPPTIAYVAQSGCLISGEKLNKEVNREQEDSNNDREDKGVANSMPVSQAKNRQADILIWNLQKDLLSKFETNPPWVISPTRVIETAHYDSILSFSYLPYSQLIASSSADCTVKLWNPIARPYSLVNQEGEASVEIKPGFYKKRKQEQTVTNEPFGEVRRIYTGDQTCFGVSSFTTSIPVLSNPEVVADNPTKRMNILEVMITCNLSKTEVINKKIRSIASIRVYSVDKMQIEVPCNRHDEVIPMKFYEQLENLSIERKKKAYVNLQMYLPTQLANLKSKKTLQQAALTKMVHLLKKISLTRFDDSQKYQMDDDIEQLFQIFIRLPSRQAFSAFLSDYDGENKVTANELFYYLKKFRSLHPLNMQRDKFFAICKEFKAVNKRSRFVSNSVHRENGLERALGASIRTKGLSINEEFARLPSAVFEVAKGLTNENMIVSKADFLGLIKRLGLMFVEDDFVEFMASIDPLFSNKVSSIVLEDRFSSEIIEYKLTQIQRPKELIESLMSKMNQRSRIRLMFSLSAVEGIAHGFLSKRDFFQAFEQASLTVDRILLEEIFEFYAEEFSEDNETKVLSVKFITKKLFSDSENLGMSKYLHTLGKIKSCLLDQGFPMEYLFRPITDDEVNPISAKPTSRGGSEMNESSVQSASGRKSQNIVAPVKKSPILTPLLQIGTSMFIHRVQQLQIPNIAPKELKMLAEFLSISDDSSQQSTVTLSHFIHYLRRITSKDHHLTLTEHKDILVEINYLLENEQSLLEWKNRYNKVAFTMADLRYILGKMDINGDQLDEIIVQFVQDKTSISLEELLTRFRDYANEKPMLKSSKQLEYEIMNTQTTDEPILNQENKASLGELIFSPRTDTIRPVVIKRRQHMEALVNYIRTQVPELIEPLIVACESRDTDKSEEIDISEFCSVLRNNIVSISEELLSNFQVMNIIDLLWTNLLFVGTQKREYIQENVSNKIEYHEFFNKYASKEEIQKISQMQYDSLINPAKEDIDVNSLMANIVQALDNSTVNVSYALKFIQNDQGMIPVEELEQLLQLIKVELTEQESEAFIDFLTENNSSLFIRSQFFLDQIYISKQGMANSFRTEVWKIALSQIDQGTLEQAKTNLIYIERFVRQKQQLIENSMRTTQRQSSNQLTQTDLKWPLVNAETFVKALSEQLQHDFDQRQQGEILAFAVVGSQLNEEKAKLKSIEVSSSDFQVKRETIHMGLLSKGIQEMAAFVSTQKKPNQQIQSMKSEALAQMGNISMDSQQQQSVAPSLNTTIHPDKQIQYLVSKIKGTLKDYGVTMWDALLSTNLSVTENSKVPAAEFKFIINSLNLKLSLQEKIMLSRIADPSNSGKCDIMLLMKKIESDDEITDHARHLILEKFSTSLFYNDMSLQKAFNLFDEDGDGIISQQEFVIGMKQLNLGLSIFEIKKLMAIIDIDQNQQLSKIEFIRAMSEKNQAFKIDPLKDFSMNLLTTIKSMINLKNADLLQAFEEIDTNQRGFIYFKDIKDAMIRFGLQNVKSYHILTLYKLYKSKPKVKDAAGDLNKSRMKASVMSNKSSTFKDNYSVSPMKPSRFGGFGGATDAVSKISDSETERQSLSFVGDDVDQQQIEEEKIDYKDLCKKIMTAVDAQAKTTVEQTNDLLRKLYKLLEQKKVSLFEAFVYFDVNGTNTISQLELRVGLKNIEVTFLPADFDRLFKAFEKTPSGKFTFSSFYNRFIESGALQVIKFDDTLDLTLKKFAQKIAKYGNFEQSFNKMDLNQNGQISIVEFKEACKRLNVGLKHEEIEMVFKSLLNADNMNFRKSFGLRQQEDIETEGDMLAVEMLSKNGVVPQQNLKTFKYRHFVKLLSQFTGKTQSEQVLYKLFKKAQERKINWKLAFQQASSGGAMRKSTKVGQKGAGNNANVEQIADISLSQCKNMLNSLKLGLTLEEVDLVVNSFLTVNVSYQGFMDKTIKAAQKLGDIEFEKSAQLQGIVSGINLYLDKNRAQMHQIFKDFNNIEHGKLRLSELNNIVRFMQIDANIHAIKLFFTTIDIDGKEYITLNELNNALAESVFSQSKQANSQKNNLDDQSLSDKQRKDIAKLEEVKGLIKIKLAERQKSLSQEVLDLGFNEQEALNEKGLESLLTNMGLALKKSDISFLYTQILKAQQAQAVGSLSFQSLLDFSIREQIEQITFDENVNFIHPTVAVCVDKVGQLFKRLELDALKGFKYMAKHGGNTVSRKEFLKLFQSYDKQFTIDELLLIYQYFDDKNYGEVNEETFVEKFDHIAYSSLAKLNRQNEQEIQEAQKSGAGSSTGANQSTSEDAASSLQKRKISTKQHVHGIMQKIFFFMQGKRYNKKQLKAVFDRNGNGILSREELLEALKLLQLGVPNDKARILLDYIDREETGRVEIDSFIADIFESIPQQYKKMYTHGNVIKILNDIVTKLGSHTSQFLNDLVACEKTVRPIEQTQMIYKVKPGITIFDFHRVLRNHGYKLSDNEKDEVKSMFMMRMNVDYFDLEQIYDMIETISYQRRTSQISSKSFIETSNVSNIWEQDVYRRIAEYLRKHNLDVEQAFHKIDQDNSGLISSSEFRRFIESLDLDLSEIKIQSLIKGYFNGLDQGTISMSSFKNKFWDAYIRYGRTDIAKVHNSRADDLESNRKKVLTYIYLTIREFTKGSMEKSWAILDQRKIGQVEIDDFRKALVQMGVYLTREELKAAFNFIDHNSSSMIRYLEFVDFWISGEEKVVKLQDHAATDAGASTAERADTFGGGSNHFLHELEESIIEHICKVINQREISLWDCFKFFNTEELGYMTRQQFSDFLAKIGVHIDDEDKVVNLMRIIDPKAFGDVVHLSSLETRLAKYGLKVHEAGVVEKIQWLDRPLSLMVVAIMKYVGQTRRLEDFFAEYDGDYDGFLSPNEFFSAFSYIGSQMGILDSAIQRLSHKLASRKSFEQGKINIVDMCEYLENMVADNENHAAAGSLQSHEDMYSIYITLEKPVFAQTLIRFDGFSSLFNSVVSIKSTVREFDIQAYNVSLLFKYLQMKKFLSMKKSKIRGLELISKQNSLFFLAQQFSHIQDSVGDGILQLRRQAQELIIERVCRGALDPLRNNYAVIDKQKIMAAQTEIEITNYRVIVDDGIFQRDEGSLRYFTPYLRYFSGQILQNGGEIVDMFVYSKDVLNSICKDGNKFVKVLDFELKLHTLLQSKYDFMVANRGVFLKRIGHELGDIEYLVINEALDPAEYMCLAEMIQQNGGLFRIPVLVKLRSATFLLKYIAKQILDILHAVNQEACFLNILRPENLFIHRRTYKIKLANVRGAAKYDLYSKVCMIPDLPINLVQRVGPLAAAASNLGYSEYFSKADKGEFKAFYEDNLHRQPYLAPEQVLKSTMEWNAYTDVWTFGSLMYHILFGKPPKSFYQSLTDQYADVDHSNFTQPSPFFHYDIYSDELAQEILSVDYNDNSDVKVNMNFIPPNDIAMVKAIDRSSFGNIFNKIFPSDGKEFEREFNQLSEVMDLIAACLQYQPSSRPTVEGMLQSSLFKQDSFENQRAMQIFETVFFYKSPSTTLREKAFDPLRQLCALAIKTPEKIDSYQIDILNIIDYMNVTLSVAPSSKIDRIKNESNLGFHTFTNKSSGNGNGEYSNQLPRRMKELLSESQEQRNKHANSALVQFVFNNDVLDMLVFLALRHHKQITLSEIETTQKTSLRKAQVNQEKMIEQRQRSIQVLTGLRELMKSLVYQLDSYTSAVSPFVHKLLENLVKFFLGEEYMLQSDMIDHLNKSVTTLPERNIHSEYLKQQETTTANNNSGNMFSRFFERSVGAAVADEADTLWAERSLSRPYIFSSRNWSPILYNIVGSLFKSTVGEAGVGRSNYPVLQDYIRLCSDKYSADGFDSEEKRKRSSSSTKNSVNTATAAPRGADYYNDLVNIAENLNILYESEKTAGSSEGLMSLLSYFKSMLRSNNTDKIKLLLDSRVAVFLIPYLNSDDIQVRTSLLEIFLEISYGFANLNYSYFNQRELKSDETNKSFGVVAHFNQSFEDKLDRKRFLECANSFYFLKQQVNRAYLFQIAFTFETPSVITNLFQVFKTKAELMNSKILVLRIFQNLVNGPEGIVKMLNVASIDVFPSVLKLLVKPKQGSSVQEQKSTKILAPIVQDIFSEIVKNGRSEIIDIMENTPGVRSLLREADLAIPNKLNLSELAGQIESIKAFFIKEREQIIHEIKAAYLNFSSAKSRDSLNSLKVLHRQSIACLDHILSWFKHYFFTCKDAAVIVEAKRLLDSVAKLVQLIISTLKEYAHVNQLAVDVIALYAAVLENISNMGLHYVLFNKYEQETSKELIEWLQWFVLDVYDMRTDSDYVSPSECVKRYEENPLVSVAHIFMRILLSLSAVQKPHIHSMLNMSQFGKFFGELVRRQHQIVKAIVLSPSKSIVVLQSYIEEANFRVVCFENIVSGSNNALKDYFMENDYLKYICSNASLQDEGELQFSVYKTALNFLPFRNFAPLRNESLAMVTAIVWHKAQSERLYKDLLIQIANEQLIKRECSNLRKNSSKSNSFLSALSFFTVLVNTNEDKLMFLMKFEKVFEFLHEFFDRNPEFKKYFPILYKAVRSQYSAL